MQGGDLADEQVDPNQADSNKFTPLNAVAQRGEDWCVEIQILHADERVEPCLASVNGHTPLISTCVQLMDSMDQVGATEGNDPTRCLVTMLKSRRIPAHNLKESIDFLSTCLPTRRVVDTAEAGGEPLLPEHKSTLFIMPILILRAQAEGEFRWFAYYYKLALDPDLDQCGGCNQVGYCKPPAELVPWTPCHAAHWKDGHTHKCKRFAAEVKAAAETEWWWRWGRWW